MALSKTDQITALALEVLEDAEMSRTSVEALVLKASRLARLVGDEETIAWLRCERFGYSNDNEIAITWVGHTHRWVDPADTNKGAYWGPIAQQETLVESLTHKLDVIKNYRPSDESGHFWMQQQQAESVGHQISAVKRIISVVRALVQQFATSIYHEKLFSHQAEAIFAQYQDKVDALLVATAKTAFDRLPQAFERLATEDAEAISHALTTCRRVVDSFADAVFASRAEPVTIGKQEIEVGAKQVRNRLRAYMYERIGQSSRYERLNKSLGSLYDRISAGVHNDIDVGEARALVLQTYLFLGELLSLPPVAAP
jgi:hypothetical protein